MSVMAGIAKAAAGARVLTETRLTTRVFPKTKWALMLALVLLALAALIAALIPASQRGALLSRDY
jgi:hypothetical protein